MKIDVLQNFSEKHLLLRMPFCNEPGHTLVDVGAFRGYFSQSFAKLNWRVIAFEPEQNNFKLCKLRLQKFPNATCYQKAVSSKSQNDATFYVSSAHPGIHSLHPFHLTHQPTSVDITTLNVTFQELGVEDVSILKIDVEGADFLVIQGLDLDVYRPEIIMLEFLDDRSQSGFGYTYHDVVAYMEQYGYKAFVSEWAELNHFGNATSNSSHQFLGCHPYPLPHQPAWGNLIFISEIQMNMFQETLDHYLSDLERYKAFRVIEWYRKISSQFPLFRKIINRLRDN
jgi:FkbM family methyltransferase